MIDRYTTEKMGRVWTLENKFQKMLQVEQAVAFVQSSCGMISKKAAQDICKTKKISVKKILEVEKKTHHDVTAFVQSVAETLGSSGDYFHYGLTSSDVLDTGLSLQVREAGEVLKRSLKELEKNLISQIRRHKKTLCVGRTHGCHAEPTTFGYKLSGYFAELQRSKGRFERALLQMQVGKFSGAVGAYSLITPSLEKKICSYLKLKCETIATQVIPRDRHCELLGSLCFLGLFLERLSVELRHLQRTEVGEVSEKFSKGQTGSSAMPHKKNPISAENLSGTARLLRSYFLASQENLALWHERDISHSCVERVSFPDSFILCDYAVNRMSNLLTHLEVNSSRMLENMELSQGQVFTSYLLMVLIKKGWSRNKAYKLLQSTSHRLKACENLKEKLYEDENIKQSFKKKEWNDIFSGKYHIKDLTKVIEKRILCGR